MIIRERILGNPAACKGGGGGAHFLAMKMEPRAVLRAAALLKEARRGWALTGAGVSTPSGIPDFRGPGGLWQTHDPEEVSSLAGFHRNPQGFYAFWLWRFQHMAQAQPNPVHHLLARLEARGHLAGVITQNIDGLHQRAGSRWVLEVHGHTRSGTCLACGRSYPAAWIEAEAERAGLARCACGGLVKPDVVLFDEALPPEFALAQREVAQADVLFVLGTSLTVWPAAGLVPLAAASGARVIIAGGEPTPFDSRAEVVLRGDLVEMATLLARALEVEGARA